jgi:hypothetical protein
VNTLTNVTEQFIDLVGGVTLAASSNHTQVWSYPNLHGDDVVTTDRSGNKTGSTLNFDPFGTPLTAENSNGIGNSNFRTNANRTVGGYSAR